MSTTKANLDPVRPQEGAEQKATVTATSDAPTLSKPTKPEVAQAPNSYAAWRSRPIATLDPYVPTSLDDIPLPPRDVLTPRDQHIIDLQIAKIAKAWRDSGRNADEYLHELDIWAAQVAEESKAAKSKSL